MNFTKYLPALFLVGCAPVASVEGDYKGLLRLSPTDCETNLEDEAVLDFEVHQDDDNVGVYFRGLVLSGQAEETSFTAQTRTPSGVLGIRADEVTSIDADVSVSYLIRNSAVECQLEFAGIMLRETR